MSENPTPSMPEHSTSRRNLIAGSAAAVGAVVLGGGLGAGTAQANTARAYTRPRVPGAVFLPEPGISHLSPQAASRGVASIMDGDSVTISLNGTRRLSGPTALGSRSIDATIVFDNGSGPADVSDKWSSWAPNASPTTNFNMARRDAGFRGINSPSGGRFLAGCHGEAWKTGTYNPNAGGNVAVCKWYPRTAEPIDAYLSCWMRADPNWVFSSTNDNNFKHFRWNVGDDNPIAPEYGPNGFGFVYPGGWPPTSHSDTSIKWNIYGNLKGTSTHILMDEPDGSVYGGIGDCANPMTKWVKYELECRFTRTDASAGFVRIYETPNGGIRRRVLNYQGRVRGLDRTYVGFAFGGYARCNNQPNNWRYYDDCFLSNTLARIVIVDGSTFDSSTMHEIQIPTAWTNESVTFNCRKGAHKDLSGKSVFIVTPDNIPTKVGTFT